MRHFALLSVAAVLTACSGPAAKDADPTIVEGTLPLDPPAAVDTGWPAGDIGNLHLAYHVNSGEAEVMAVASEWQPGYLNYAQCAILGVPCLNGIPSEEDDWKDIDLGQSIDREEIHTRFLGFEISYGPYILTYQEDPDTAFGFYGSPVDVEDLPEDREIGPTWGGQWKEYSAKDDLFVSRPIEVLNPAPGQNITFTNGEMVPLEWVPTGEGKVTLLLSTRFTLARLYNLEDDGYFELDVNSLPLTNDQEDITFTFMRWNQTTLQTYGHVVELLATSDLTFTGQYYNIGARDFIEPADGCAEANGLAALEAGDYWGWLGNKANDLSPSAACLNDGAANGKDAMARLEVAAKDVVTVDYNTYDESASVYLLTDCEDENSCVTGADLNEDPNVPEYLRYFNDSDEPQTLFVVMDTTASANTIFTLDLTITPVLRPDFYDGCLDAQAAIPSLVTGVSQVLGTGGWVDDLNPGAGGCTGTSLGGAEGMTPIEVPDAATLDLAVDMPGHDPGIYLLTDCANAFSCVAGADTGLDTNENLSWTNTSGSPATVYVVVDSKTGPGTFNLSVEIN